MSPLIILLLFFLWILKNDNLTSNDMNRMGKVSVGFTTLVTHDTDMSNAKSE